jgi:putative endonuclease
MGVGHVPQEPIRTEGASAELQRLKHRRTAAKRSVGTSVNNNGIAARRNARGKWAEECVARWYAQHGYTVIARNFRSKRGELDVVLMHGTELVVCEVKARANNAFGFAAEAVTLAKQLKVRRATFDYVEHLRMNDAVLHARIRSTRFDVATMTGVQLEVLPNAF